MHEKHKNVGPASEPMDSAIARIEKSLADIQRELEGLRETMTVEPMLALSWESLKEDWLSPEDEEAWKDL